ncbi:thiopeptide-type bacteriocin biosynthesis protein [Actinomyces bowdenii]|uniref:thiopeptide-type bacteriocin biosynthesis protein n=1 Tax=Actinomyces bowdenii TaxID=131109 RepID=UPI001ABCE658|nr:thiopeptide-type bacteriocin biosynthesis protein [Actinomyces bowdenii]MBO3725010.1 thiopeptide-type bacteriocin biosynthesis protein [Actinomyces bowdenii]
MSAGGAPGAVPGRGGTGAGTGGQAPPQERQGAGADWLFVRLYCGGGDDTDALLPRVAQWLEEVRAHWPILSAHFLRFIDLRGHHVRLRVKAGPDDLDEIAARLGALEDASRAAPVRTVERLVPDPLTRAVDGRAGASLAVYGPEYGKYGPGAGVEAAERHFEASSRWCLTHRVWQVPRPVPRVALAARLLARAAGQLPLDPADLLALHLRTWGRRLPEELRDGTALDPLVRQVLGYDGRDLAAWSTWAGSVDEPAQDAAIAISRIGAGPQGRRAIDLLHMDINRLGLNAAEECVAGVCARYLLQG